MQHLGSNGTTPAVWVNAAQQSTSFVTEQLSGRSLRLQPCAGAIIAVKDVDNHGVDMNNPPCFEGTCDGIGIHEANMCWLIPKLGTH